VSFWRLFVLAFVAAFWGCVNIPILAQESDTHESTGTNPQSVQKPDDVEKETSKAKDGILPPPLPPVPERSIPFYSVHAIGVQGNFILPAKNVVAFFKYYDEYRSLARPEGRTIDFGFSWTLRMPKPAPQPQAAKP
jgi:hypothetical protein